MHVSSAWFCLREFSGCRLHSVCLAYRHVTIKTETRRAPGISLEALPEYQWTQVNSLFLLAFADFPALAGQQAVFATKTRQLAGLEIGQVL